MFTNHLPLPADIAEGLETVLEQVPTTAGVEQLIGHVIIPWYVTGVRLTQASGKLVCMSHVPFKLDEPARTGKIVDTPFRYSEYEKSAMNALVSERPKIPELGLPVREFRGLTENAIAVWLGAWVADDDCAVEALEDIDIFGPLHFGCH